MRHSPELLINNRYMQKKLLQLKKKYNGFINVIADDWRGPRFIFDTKDVRKCNNDCKNCPLYLLLKNEKENNKENNFSAALYKADKNDKIIFGPQNFLNCKTLKQYKNCYVNFLLKKAKNKKEIQNELKLILNMKVIYSRNKNRYKTEKQFKKSAIKKILLLVNPSKKKIITAALNPTTSPAPF